jgi:anti-anti-sigma regulatory factor
MRQPSQSPVVSPSVAPEIVTVPTEVDAVTAGRLGPVLIAAFRPDVAVVIADMSRTAWCDASWARQLLWAQRHAASRDAELRIVASQDLLTALRPACAERALLVYPAMSAALTGVPPRRRLAEPLAAVPETGQDQVRLRSSGGLAIVTTPGEVGSKNAQEFWEVLAEACASHPVTIADMTGTLVCGHDAVTALLMAMRRTDASGGELWLVLSDAVGKLVGATAIASLFPTFHRLSDALASLRVRRPELV